MITLRIFPLTLVLHNHIRNLLSYNFICIKTIDKLFNCHPELCVCTIIYCSGSNCLNICHVYLLINNHKENTESSPRKTQRKTRSTLKKNAVHFFVCGWREKHIFSFNLQFTLEAVFWCQVLRKSFFCECGKVFILNI